MLLLQSYQYPNLSEGADRVGGQLRGDKEYPFSGVTKSSSLEEGAGKRCSECDYSSVPHSPSDTLTQSLCHICPSVTLTHLSLSHTDTQSICHTCPSVTLAHLFLCHTCPSVTLTHLSLCHTCPSVTLTHLPCHADTFVPLSH